MSSSPPFWTSWAANENQLLTRPVRRRMVILGSRMDRYLGAVRNLQDIISQMREAYQSQLAIPAAIS